MDRAQPVVLPDGYDPVKPAPLIIALHGRGGNGKNMAAAWDEIANDVGAILVAPDALRPLGMGYDWRFVDESEWLVLLTLDRVLERYAIDEQRIVLTGLSQGAHIAFMMIGSEDRSVETYRVAIKDFKEAGWNAKLRKVLAFVCDPGPYLQSPAATKPAQ